MGGSGITQQERTKQKYRLGDHQCRDVDDIDADKPRNEITREIKAATLHGAQYKKYDNGLVPQLGNELNNYRLAPVGSCS